MKPVEIVRKKIMNITIIIPIVLPVLWLDFKMLTASFEPRFILVYGIANLIVLTLWSAKNIIVVDFDNKQIKEGFKVLGYSHTRQTKFIQLEKVFINKILGGWSGDNVRTIGLVTKERDYYKAYLKTQEGNKYWIGNDTDKNKLIDRLRGYNEYLRTEMYDQTGMELIRID